MARISYFFTHENGPQCTPSRGGMGWQCRAVPRMADFTSNLALVNGIAERSAGFVWRYSDESGSATNTRPYADLRIIVNFSVWESVAALEHFVWQTVHKHFSGRRTEWFEHFDG